MKAAVIIFSDPTHGGEEALGRAFNALAAAYDFKQKQIEVSVYFQGTGTRWVSHLTQVGHPLYALYSTLNDVVVGVSCGCADVFGAREAAEKQGFDLVTDNRVPGTSGLPSIAQLASEGYTVFSF